LAFLLDPAKSEVLIETSANFPSPALDISQENLRAQAMKNRPDLQAARATLRSQQAALSVAKWQRLPAAIVSAGYKKSVDDFNGAVVQANIGIPLFNRNQGEIRSARAALDRQVLVSDLLEKQVVVEVRQAFEKYVLYRRLIERFLNGHARQPQQLLEIAQFSYTEGEMELIELLDGVRAYIEFVQTKYDLFLNYQLSIFELERVTATAIINRG
jgi:cobalt-zinc-cadmium efflux system outer membrane protein